MTTVVPRMPVAKTREFFRLTGTAVVVDHEAARARRCQPGMSRTRAYLIFVPADFSARAASATRADIEVSAFLR